MNIPPIYSHSTSTNSDILLTDGEVWAGRDAGRRALFYGIINSVSAPTTNPSLTIDLSKISDDLLPPADLIAKLKAWAAASQNISLTIKTRIDTQPTRDILNTPLTSRSASTNTSTSAPSLKRSRESFESSNSETSLTDRSVTAGNTRFSGSDGSAASAGNQPDIFDEGSELDRWMRQTDSNETPLMSENRAFSSLKDALSSWMDKADIEARHNLAIIEMMR